MKNFWYRAIAGAVALLAVLAGFGLFANARAAAIVFHYYVYVNGVEATSENCDDVLGDGTAKFVPSTYTLYLSDAKITQGMKDNQGQFVGIRTIKDDLTITGSASISGVDCGIDVSGHLDITDADIDIDLDHKDVEKAGYAIRAFEMLVENSKLDLTLNVPEGVEESSVNTDAFDCHTNFDFKFTDSTVKVDGFRKALATNGCTINNSRVDLRSIENDEFSSNFTIDGKDSVVSIETTGERSYGFKSGDLLEVNDGQLIVKGKIRGISTYVLEVTGDTARVDAICTGTDPQFDNKALSALYFIAEGGTIKASGGKIGIDCFKEMTVSGKDTEIIASGSEKALDCYAEKTFETPIVLRYPAKAAFNEGVLQLNGENVLYAEIGKPHTLTRVPYKAPTLTSEGNKEYYTCSDCDEWFWDNGPSKIIEDHASVIIPKAAPATATPTPTVAATPTSSGSSATPTSKPTGAPVTGTPTAVPTGAVAPTVVPSADPKAQILAFVERIYIYVLDREPEEEGAAFWSEELYAFRRTGAEVAQGFIFSEEFASRNTSDTEFVTILYKTFFGRDPEEDGLNFWLAQLSSGTMDRVAVANGFIYSQEWAETCASYGIRSGGDLKPKGAIAPTELTYAFVERMYTTAMGRSYDEEGRQYWASELANFNITGEACGASFFLSAEMEGYKLSDKEFLGRLYATFMNREADSEGEAYWLSQMSAGVPRADVVFGFTRSPEFTEKCVEARILPY